MRVKLNPKAYEFAKQLIHERKIDDKKGSAELKHHTPTGKQQDEFLKSHPWAEYSKWHLGIHFDRPENSKESYEFPIGDFTNIVKADLIEVQRKAHEYRYMDIEQAAKELIAHIDKKTNKV